MEHTEFRKIYDTYYLDVLRFVRGFTKTQADVEEIVQDVFINVFKNFDKFRGDASLRTWIMTISRNAVTDYWRRSQKYGSQTTLDIEDVSPNLLQADAKAGPEARTQHSETLRQIEVCLRQLPEAMRLVLICRAVHSYSTLETAAILEWSGTRVRVTYGRALKKFRSLWIATYGQIDDSLSSTPFTADDIC